MSDQILPRPGRNDDIECLRAIAVLGVMFHHMQGNLFYSSTVAGMLKYADFWFGVDLFFAISGFIIALNLLPQLTSENLSWPRKAALIKAFWIRRVWRLLPSAWLWLGLIMIAVLTFNRSGAFGTVHANLMATLVGIGNVANFRFADAFFRYEYGASFVYWSLSLEEQFYLLLPLLVALLQRRIAWLMLALFIFQLIVVRTPLLMSVRTDALTLGVLLAIVTSSRLWLRLNPSFLHKMGGWRTLFSMPLLAALIALSSTSLESLRFRMSLIALMAATLVWVASYNQDYILRKGPIKQGLVWIGVRSYALYLIHVPVYFLLREICFRFGIAGTPSTSFLIAILVITSCLVTAALANLNYRYVEQPLRDYGRQLADKSLRHRLVHDRTIRPSLELPDDKTMDIEIPRKA